MSEKDLNTYKKYVSDLDITKYIILDNESNYWYSAEYVDKMLKKQDKEIERLNKKLKSLQDSYDIEEEQANYHIDLTDDLREEVDRLNNIINELEKWIKENDLGKYRTENVIDTDELLNKLQKLKGSE